MSLPVKPVSSVIEPHVDDEEHNEDYSPEPHNPLHDLPLLVVSTLRHVVEVVLHDEFQLENGDLVRDAKRELCVNVEVIRWIAVHALLLRHRKPDGINSHTAALFIFIVFRLHGVLHAAGGKNTEHERVNFFVALSARREQWTHVPCF